MTRLPKRATYDRDTIYAILDEALFCTLGYVRDGTAFQIPTGHCRVGDTLYIHGSVGSAYMRELAETRALVSVSATLMDAIVLARSAFHHSVNYRSVVLFSNPERVTDDAELDLALKTFTNKMQPGRWDDVRKPTRGEWKATMVLRFRIKEASAKVRSGGPIDDEEDYALNIWAGIVPLKMQRLAPVADPHSKNQAAIPAYLKNEQP